jgi:hypothetical protein
MINDSKDTKLDDVTDEADRRTPLTIEGKQAYPS